MTIRPFTPDDYAALTALHNTVCPERPQTESEIRRADTERNPKHHFGRFVAEDGGAIVGRGEFDQLLFNYHPQKFVIELMVLQEARRRGIGGALYDTVWAGILPHDPVKVRANAREDRAESLTFLTQRGFVEEMRHWESYLDVPSFDSSRFAADEEKAKVAGVVVKTYADLKDEPDILPRLFELTTTVATDVPSPDEGNGIEYEQWLKFFDGPHFSPDAVFVAQRGDEFVGFSNLFLSEADDTLHTGLTGVRREHRGLGVATALKLRAIAFAVRVGAPRIRTSNESNNRAMLGINERLGFVKQPAKINLAKFVKEESAA